MSWVNLPGVVVLYFHVDLPSILRTQGEKILHQVSFHQQMHSFIKYIKYLYVCSYMFRSNWTILRERMLRLAKATILWN